MTCGRALTRDEIGLSKKMTNRGAAQFQCLTCLAARYQIGEERLLQRIAQLRAQGCFLFDDSVHTQK